MGVRDVVVTNINQERYDALILQMPAKPLPSCDKVVVGCVVPLRTLHIVKISSTRRMKNCTLQPKLCMEDLRLIWSLPWNELKPGLLCRSCERWENSFRVFRALITESQSYFERGERVKRFIVVTAPSAPLTLQSGNYSAVRISLCFLASRNWIYLRPKESYKEKKIIFTTSINQCT